LYWNRNVTVDNKKNLPQITPRAYFTILPSPRTSHYLYATTIRHTIAKFDEVATVKYIDPSYTIRTVAANAADSLYCMQLAQNACHGAMAGFTGFSIGLCNNRMVRFLKDSQMFFSATRTNGPSFLTLMLFELTTIPGLVAYSRTCRNECSFHECKRAYLGTSVDAHQTTQHSRRSTAAESRSFTASNQRLNLFALLLLKKDGTLSTLPIVTSF
jgi:hypothetical protein